MNSETAIGGKCWGWGWGWFLLLDFRSGSARRDTGRKGRGAVGSERRGCVAMVLLNDLGLRPLFLC